MESSNPRTGDHRPKGFVLAKSLDLAASKFQGEMAIVDFAPTIAARLGIKLTVLDGKPIPELLGHGVVDGV